MTVGVLGVAACGKEAETTASSTAGFELDRKLLDAFVDTIVPKDQDPGAVEAGMADELLERFEKKPEEKKKAMDMLNTIDNVAIKKFNNPFKKLKLEHREKVIDLTLRSRDRKYTPARSTIHKLRTRIVWSYYLSPTGQAMLGYNPPFPLGYPDYNQPPS
jgi:hypothetical protein